MKAVELAVVGIAFACLVECAIGIIIGSSEDKVSKTVNKICLGCICEAASDCDRSVGCVKDVCGLFKITRPYWVDSGRPVLTNDDPNDNAAFTRCVSEPFCAAKAVENYTAKYRKATLLVSTPETTSLVSTPESTSLVSPPEATSLVSTPEAPLLATLLVSTPETTSLVSTPESTSLVSPPEATSLVSTPEAPLLATLLVSTPETTSLVSTPESTSLVSPPEATSLVSTPEAPLLVSTWAKRQAHLHWFVNDGEDCNGDGVVNCFDYAAIHHLGGFGCDGNLEESFKVKLQSCLEEFQNSDSDYS
uniref:lysozyme n=1 Tax=Timema tahoe TaxID=61484 RepID=A0A7R9II02_9NEOP|nr:unnamed protein product [Timema tahoe]